MVIHIMGFGLLQPYLGGGVYTVVSPIAVLALPFKIHSLTCCGVFPVCIKSGPRKQQGHGPRLSDACGERRLAHVVPSNLLLFKLLKLLMLQVLIEKCQNRRCISLLCMGLHQYVHADSCAPLKAPTMNT